MQKSSYKKSSALTKIFTGALLLLGACGRVELGEFASYVQTFEAESLARGQEVRVTNLMIRRDATLPSTVRAQCQENTFSPPTIVVNEAIWDKSSESDREALIMHEMGHCVLHRDHKGGDFSDGTAVSLMRPVSPYGKSYASRRQYYLDELFDSAD